MLVLQYECLLLSDPLCALPALPLLVVLFAAVLAALLFVFAAAGAPPLFAFAAAAVAAAAA